MKSSSIFSSSYENVTFSELMPSNATLSLPVTSSTTGSSSSMLSTLFPAANVLCNVLPSAASATAGPNDENSATVVRSTPSKPITPSA